MPDIVRAWTSWARRLRGRWTPRRLTRAALELVWLRLRWRSATERPTAPSAPAVTVRLAIHTSVTTPIAVHRGPAPAPALGRRSAFPRLRHGETTVRPAARPFTATGSFGSIGAARPMVAPWTSRPTMVRTASAFGAESDEGAGVFSRPGRETSSVSPPLGGHPRGALGLVLRPGLTRRWAGGVPAGDLAPVMHFRAARAGRREERVLAPPPMVARTSGRGGAAERPAPAASETGPALTRSTDPRGAWPLAVPASGGIAVSPVTLASLADQVMRQINDRVRAKRERLGKV